MKSLNTRARKLPPFWHFHWWRQLPYFGSLMYPVPLEHCRCGMVRKWITPEAASVHWPDAELQAKIDGPADPVGDLIKERDDWL